MTGKKYFWLKLKIDFFESKEVKLLRRVAGGDTFTIIYLKMLLQSLKENGFLYFDGVCNDIAEEIALTLDEEIESVRLTLAFLEAKKLIEFGVDDDLKMTRIDEMIGFETDSAERVRRFRERNQAKALQCNGDVTLSNGDVTFSNTEIEKEKEKEKEKDIDIDKKRSKPDDSQVNEIWNLYPRKEGKAIAIKKIPALIKKHGYDEIKKAVERYAAVVKSKGTETQYIKTGSTFFNTGYVDYLTENYTGPDGKTEADKPEWKKRLESEYI